MYKGQIKDFPKEVVEKMLERQVEQGNEKDVSVFEKDRYIVKSSGGFSWSNTIEKFDFWNSVLFRKDFNLFLKNTLKNK